MHALNANGDVDRAALDGVVLAGGRGLRMQHADKGLMHLHGRPLVAHVLDALQPQVARCMISTNRNTQIYAQFNVPLVHDVWLDSRGPLAGIDAAAQQCSRTWLLAAPCDMPGLPADLAAQLLRAAAQMNSSAAYAVIDGNAAYPLCLLHCRCFAALRTALEQGHYAVGRWLTTQGAVAVPINNWVGPPLNLNTPERLSAAHTIYPWK